MLHNKNKHLYLLRNKQKGLNLVELLVSLSIMAILSAIAAPNFSQWMGNMKIKSVTESVQSGLTSARAEAIKTNAPISFNLSANGDWNVSRVNDSQILLSSGSSGSNESVQITTVPSDATTVTFNSLGRRVDNIDASSAITSLSLVSASSQNGVYSTNIFIDNGGSSTYCSNNPNSYNPC